MALKKIQFPAKNARALNLDVFEKGRGMLSPRYSLGSPSLPLPLRLGLRPKTRHHFNILCLVCEVRGRSSHEKWTVGRNFTAFALPS